MREFIRKWLGITDATPGKPTCKCIQHEETCSLYVVPPPPTFKRGDRVRVKRHGWNPGATGTIEFQEPNGNRCWMVRDRADGPLYWMNHELELIKKVDDSVDAE